MHSYFNCVAQASGKDCPSTLKYKHKFGIERDAKAETVLLAFENCMEHLFGDIISFLPKKLQKRVRPVLAEGGADFELRQAIISCAVSRVAWCVRCGKECSLSRTSQHIAGSPCTDHSDLGNKKLFAGKTAPVFWTWCALMRSLLIPILCHENVEGFDNSELKSILGDLYWIVRLHVCPRETGWASNRKRVWDVMILKALLDPHLRSVPTPMESMETFVKTIFGRIATYDWSAYLLDEDSDAYDWQLDRKWAANRKDVRARHSGGRLVSAGHGEDLLCPGELARWDLYKTIVLGNSLVCDLGQDPSHSAFISGGHGRLQVFTHGMGIYYFTQTSSRMSKPRVSPRFMSRNELYQYMAFPRKQCMQEISGEHHPYSSGRCTPADQTRASSSCEQIGNSQHVGAVGPFMFALALLLKLE